MEPVRLQRGLEADLKPEMSAVRKKSEKRPLKPLAGTLWRKEAADLKEKEHIKPMLEEEEA